MGMSSKDKKISKDSLEAMDMKKAIASEEKCITRSHFKDDKFAGPHTPLSQHYLSKHLDKDLAEVFRTDFITAMKVPDSQQLPPGEYLTLKDTWRQEWEKGVQVPVNPEKMPRPIIKNSGINVEQDPNKIFELPESFIQFDEKKYIEKINEGKVDCDYDLDDTDMEWLKHVNSLRTLKKGKQATSIDAMTMERAITWFERECFAKMAHAVATKEGLSIEYDESTTCNVCLSPDAEDGNEIIFCDACNMCVHQHCYGVLEIPEGNWLCNPCSRGVLSPPCCLCPAKGGAMKRMKDSYEWIHVICAWWIPEVKIEDVKFIERIRKDKIPASRWNLLCYICREKSGACIQCTVKRCVKAYHVTCGVKEGLEMKTVVVPDKDDVQHISFCEKHCTPKPPEQNPITNRSGEEIENNRLKEIRKLESEFYNLVSVTKASRELKMSKEAARRLHSYWTIKRRENENSTLIPLTLEQQEKLSGKQGVVLLNQQKTLEMERFLHLRQDLERLRNLCYMIVRREKLRKELHRSAMEIFYKQNEILLDTAEASGDNLNIISPRSTRFSNFSENYVTESQLEERSGTKVTMFDSTAENEDILLNSSAIEVYDEKDIQRDIQLHKKSTTSKSEWKTLTSTPEKSSISTTESVKNNADHVETTRPERNIFDLLDKKKETKEIKVETEEENDLKEQNEQSSQDVNTTEDEIFECDEQRKETNTNNVYENLNLQSELKMIETSSKSNNKASLNMKQTFINFKPIIKENKNNITHSNAKHMTKDSENGSNSEDIRENGHGLNSNGISDNADDIIPTKISRGKSKKEKSKNLYSTEYEINNTSNFRSSSLAKKGKKRFRNLHPEHDNDTRRNSPRLSRNSDIVHYSLNENNILVEADQPPKPRNCTPVEQETKRRRLNSCGESLTENEDEHFVPPPRITRSRVSSCS